MRETYVSLFDFLHHLSPSCSCFPARRYCVKTGAPCGECFYMTPISGQHQPGIIESLHRVDLSASINTTCVATSHMLICLEKCRDYTKSHGLAMTCKGTGECFKIRRAQGWPEHTDERKIVNYANINLYLTMSLDELTNWSMPKNLSSFSILLRHTVGNPW